MHVEILLPEGRVKDQGQMISRSHRKTAQNPLCLVCVRQTPTGIDIQVLPAPTQATSKTLDLQRKLALLVETLRPRQTALSQRA